MYLKKKMMFAISPPQTHLVGRASSPHTHCDWRANVDRANADNAPDIMRKHHAADADAKRARLDEFDAQLLEFAVFTKRRG